MASTEDKAYEIMRELDVNYVLVIFGGLTGYSSDGKYMYCKIISAMLLSRSVTFISLFTRFVEQRMHRLIAVR